MREPSALKHFFDKDLLGTYYVPGPAMGIQWGEETQALALSGNRDISQLITQ